MEGLKQYYADLHIHIGRTERGKPVKISAASNLTFFNIAREASVRKGLEVIGVIDCHSPAVQDEIEGYLKRGDMEELRGGGIRYGRTTVILGTEIEVKDAGMGPAHLLAYFPGLLSMKDFSRYISRHMKNVELSSQRVYVAARDLQDEVAARGGLLVPAHIFTPYRSVYGSAANRMSDLLDMKRLSAVELGLSSDTQMASSISELDGLAFLSNSDAHSLGKIGREYNTIAMREPSFQELALALRGALGRKVTANYGLNPRLGKYHRTYCSDCGHIPDGVETAARQCPSCGSHRIVRGVLDRIRDIADRPEGSGVDGRPPYYEQVPLEFMPGVGPKLLNRLLERFGTEMNVLHHVPVNKLQEEVGERIARMIGEARAGVLRLRAGGGGAYGRVSRDEAMPKT